MIKKIKEYLLKILFSNYAAILLAFSVMLLLCLFNLINTVFLASSTWTMLLFIPLAFCVPLAFFILSRKERYFPSYHFAKIKKYHVPTIIYSFFLLIFASILLKSTFFESIYTSFSLYNTFSADIQGGFFKKLYLILSFCIIPPILEELVYRGIIIKEYDKRGRLTATLISSILFSLLGFNVYEIPQRFFMGIILCILLYATGSIFICVAIHILYNVFALFFEPTLVSLKYISSNSSTFLLLITVATLIMATCLCSHLSRLYNKYSKDKNYVNFKRSTPRERTFWHFLELFISTPSLACVLLFAITTLILNI